MFLDYNISGFKSSMNCAVMEVTAVNLLRNREILQKVHSYDPKNICQSMDTRYNYKNGLPLTVTNSY